MAVRRFCACMGGVCGDYMRNSKAVKVAGECQPKRKCRALEGLQLKINLIEGKILSGSWKAFPGGMVSKGSGEWQSPGT